jgi:hypothetical protein
MPTGFHRDCAVGQLSNQGPSLPTRLKGLEVDIDRSLETSGLTTAQTGSVQRQLIYLLLFSASASKSMWVCVGALNSWNEHPLLLNFVMYYDDLKVLCLG